MTRVNIPLALNVPSGAAQLGTDGKVGGPGGSTLESSILQMASGAAPLVDPATALVGGNVLYFDSASGKFKGRSSSVPFQVLYPSGDTSGVTDDTNMAAAIAALPNGGLICPVANFSTPFYTAAGWNPPQQTVSGTTGGGPVCIQGIGWPVLFPVGAAVTGINYHRTTNYDNTDHNTGGYIRDIVVDGTLATGASIGIDAGDAFNMHIRAQVQNFTGTGAIGFRNINRVFFTEKCNFEIQSYNNTVAHKLGQSGVSDSHEYNDYNLVIWARTDQDGLQVTSGTGGCRFWIRGNMMGSSTNTIPTNNVAMLSVTGAQGNMQHCQIWARVEINSGGGAGANPYSIYSDGSGSITNCSGQIGCAANMTQALMNGAECSFRGPMVSSAIPGWPSSNSSTAVNHNGGTMTVLPASGTQWNNLGSDAIVGVSGGTVSNIRVNNTHGLGVTSGVFFVPAGGYLTLFYTAAPTVVLTSADPA